MATGDGLLVRVKPPLNRLTAAAARVLASAASGHGNGIIELTGRACLQLRGFSARSAPLFAQAVLREGLAAADPAVERRRNLLVGPLADKATEYVARSLEILLTQAATLKRLPAKFTFAVDGGALALPAGNSDLHSIVQPAFCDISLGGSGRAARVALRQAAPASLRLAQAFLSLARDERRMDALVERLGDAALFDAAELVPTGTRPAMTGSPSPIGLFADGDSDAFGAGLPFGSIEAPILTALADLADRYGDGLLRLTPWRAIVIAGVDRSAEPALRRAVDRLGLISAADDHRLRVSACPGQPGCASASVPTRPIAAQLLPAAGTTIHVSGCSKGCAHPDPATLTLVGRDGRFDLVHDGRASDTPVLRGLTAAEAIRAA